jgi:hypothetical protein
MKHETSEMGGRLTKHFFVSRPCFSLNRQNKTFCEIGKIKNGKHFAKATLHEGQIS